MAYKPSKTELELSDFISSRDAQLESANQKLVYGDGIYPGTKLLRDYYAGDQWESNAKRGGGSARTFNYCRRIVENNTAFLANEPPEVSVQSLDTSSEIENLRAELIAKQLTDIHIKNNLDFEFQKMVKVASITGVFFIFGPIWNDNVKRIEYKSFATPENVRPIWRDSHFGEMIGFINRYRMEVDTFFNIYGKQLKKRGVSEDQIKGERVWTNQYTSGSSYGKSHDFRTIMYDHPMIEIIEYYDDQYYMMKINTGNKESITVDFKEHKYGFIPGQYLPNVYDPSSDRGTSDLEDIISSQTAYNEAKSNEEDIIAQTAYPQYFGKNLDNFSYVRTPEHGVIINLNENGELNALPRSGTPFPIETFQQSIQADMINLAGQNQAMFPGGSKQVLASSGRALSVLMQPVNNNIALKKTVMKMALEKLNRNILLLMEKKVKGAKELIGGNYDAKVFLSSVLTRDVNEEINKFNSKIQSLSTTQKNLGIPSPSEEQKLMKNELKDPILGIETARQPGMIQQAMQMEIQNQMALQQEAISELGVENNPALLSGGPGTTQPMAAPGQGRAVASPEGEVAAQAQRNTGVNLAREA